MGRHHVIGQVLVVAENALDERVIDLVFAETLAVVLLYPAGVASAEDWLNPRTRLRDNRTRAHRRHGNQGAIAQTVLGNFLLQRLG
ncbi:MAG: hypothetical protein J4F35_01360 [Candidatus Latescibacteria bacterium]|nr:hypothetical protein [Candidatus Latescibacterota bacterium]